MRKATSNLKVWLGVMAMVTGVMVAGGSLGQVHAEEPSKTGVEVNETNFPDETFRNYVRENFDSNLDGKLSEAEIKGAEEVSLPEEEVSSVKGIEYLSALKKLNLNSTHVSEVDVTKNPELERLDLGMINEMDEEFNMTYTLSSIDVTKNPKLKYLDITYSNVDQIDVTKNPELEELHVFMSKISNLDLSNNKKLRRLDANNTNLEKVDVTKNLELFALNLEYTDVSSVDVTKNPKLYEIYLTGDDKITSINLTKNPKLGHLRVSGTNIHSLDLSGNKELAAFYNCKQTYENPITWEEEQIEAAPIEKLDFSHANKMFEIYLDGSPIKSIDVSNQRNLRHLQIRNTAIKSVDVTKNPKLASLCVTGTPIKKLDISKNKKLATLDIENTNISNMKHIDFTGYKEIDTVKAKNAGVESIIFDKAPSVRNVELDENHVKEIDLEGRENQETWNFLVLGKQTPTIAVPESKLVNNTIALKDLFSDPSRVTVKEDDGYTYDQQTKKITFKDAKNRTFNYTWDTKYHKGEDALLNATATIATKKAIASVKLGKTSYTYTGKSIRPSVTVKNQDGKVVSKDNYTISYTKSVYPGKYTVKVTGKNTYLGTVFATYKINPKASAVKSLKKGKKQMKVTWTKQSSSCVSGYQIKYSTSKNFSKKSTKTVTVNSYKATTKTIKKLKANKKYYVRVRAYKNVKGSKYYSTWSKTKSVKL